MKKSLTSRERIMRIFYNKTPDRPAIKLWGLEPDQELKHPAYEEIYRLGIQYTDLVPYAESPINLLFGGKWDDISEIEVKQTDSDEWIDIETKVHLPGGRTLKSIYRRSTIGKPGRIMEFFIKEPDDLSEIIKIPYEPYPFNPKSFFEMENKVADRGVTTFILPEPVYHLQRYMGSENLAVMSRDCRDLIIETLNMMAKRVKLHVIEAFKSDIKTIMGWTGPEICIPPLMSLDDFEDFVFAIDKPIIDLVHESGGRFWVHSHGKMSNVIERFAEMGVDVLNPIEPPPMGDINLEDAFCKVGDRMGLEGNIEVGELMLSSNERIKYLVRNALDIGKRYGRFILCPSSGYMETPEPSDKLIENFVTYIEEATSYCSK